MANRELATLIKEGDYDQAARMAERLPAGPKREEVYQTLYKTLKMQDRFEEAMNCALQMQDRREMQEGIYSLFCDRLCNRDYHRAKEIIMHSGTWIDEDYWRQKLEHDLLPELLDKGQIEEAKIAVHCMHSQLCKDYLFCYLVRELRATQAAEAMRILSYIVDDRLRADLA